MGRRKSWRRRTHRIPAKDPEPRASGESAPSTTALLPRRRPSTLLISHNDSSQTKEPRLLRKGV
jgi:hypothetical protein